MRTILGLAVITASLLCSTRASAVSRITIDCRGSTAPRLCSISSHYHHVNQLRRRLGLAPLPYGGLAERYPALRDRVLTYWTRTHQRTLLRYLGVTVTSVPEPYYSNLMCIHRLEGSMVSLNPAGPYYGGWQMSTGFMQTWGGDMLAKYGMDARGWSPHDQLVVAYRAAKAIGYGSWPATSRLCGL